MFLLYIIEVAMVTIFNAQAGRVEGGGGLK